MNTAIETNRLTKRYGRITAVEDLSLRVAQGEIYAFLGLNGAGKTTTIRMLLGMVKPTRGEASVLGESIRRGTRQPWSRVGYLVETANAYPELTVRENMETMRRLRPGTPPASVSDAIEHLGLSAYADQRAGTLSLGNKQRLGLAKALFHTPALLFLDEPANGLDPAGIVEIRNLLLELARQQGVTIFMSSHILGEVSRLAHRIGIIHHGRLLQELDVDELERDRHKRVLVRSRDAQAACQVLRAAGYPAQMLPEELIEIRGEAALASTDELATLLVHAGQAPSQLYIEQEDLEGYFLRMVGEPQAGLP